jgi:hypothetical protein
VGKDTKSFETATSHFLPAYLHLFDLASTALNDHYLVGKHILVFLSSATSSSEWEPLKDFPQQKVHLRFRSRLSLALRPRATVFQMAKIS